VNSRIKSPPKSGKKESVPWASVTIGLSKLKANKGAMRRQCYYAQNDAQRRSGGKESDLKLGKDCAFVAKVAQLVNERHYGSYHLFLEYGPRSRTS